jgi:chorismate synthase
MEVKRRPGRMLMASNSFGEIFRITTFGESHGPAVGVVVDGVPPGLKVDARAMQREMDRRRPGGSSVSSARDEPDRLEILSGIFEGVTTGAPVAMIVRNRDARPGNYSAISDVFRPGHADYTWWKKYGIRDWRGGGRSSGRETAARVAAGALARQIIAREGVEIFAHVVSIGGIRASSCDRAEAGRNPVRCGDARAAKRMLKAIAAAKKTGDTLGGIVEITVYGVPPGWGDPVFSKLDAVLGSALLSIGAVKGVEFGDGFALSEMKGSRANDPITPGGFDSNRAGGVLGGISNGAPIVARIAVKPTPSVSMPQHTVDVDNNARTIKVPGRHDPCICPRIVPVAEAMTAIVLCDAFLRQRAVSLRESEWPIFLT